MPYKILIGPEQCGLALYSLFSQKPKYTDSRPWAGGSGGIWTPGEGPYRGTRSNQAELHSRYLSA